MEMCWILADSPPLWCSLGFCFLLVGLRPFRWKDTEWQSRFQILCFKMLRFKMFQYILGIETIAFKIHCFWRSGWTDILRITVMFLLSGPVKYLLQWELRSWRTGSSPEGHGAQWEAPWGGETSGGDLWTWLETQFHQRLSVSLLQFAHLHNGHTN